MKEIRSCNVETRSEDSELILTGFPVVFDEPTTINDGAGGSYTEIICNGALDNCDLSDVTLRIEHDNSRIPLARTPNTLTLRVVPGRGLEMTANLPDTADGKAVYTSVARRDMRGMSFAFVVPKGGDSFDVKTNTRRINQISKIYECSICAIPAYSQTSVEARSAQNEARQRAKAENNVRFLISQILH